MGNENHTRFDDTLSRDAAFSLLGNRRRRQLVEILSERGSPVALDELAQAIASPEAETADEIAISLHHAHLPKLAEANVVDYEPESRVVTHTRTDELTSYFETAGDRR